jgi:hypothetical protein
LSWEQKKNVRSMPVGAVCHEEYDVSSFGAEKVCYKCYQSDLALRGRLSAAAALAADGQRRTRGAEASSSIFSAIRQYSKKRDTMESGGEQRGDDVEVDESRLEEDERRRLAVPKRSHDHRDVGTRDDETSLGCCEEVDIEEREVNPPKPKLECPSLNFSQTTMGLFPTSG